MAPMVMPAALVMTKAVPSATSIARFMPTSEPVRDVDMVVGGLPGRLSGVGEGHSSPGV